MKCVASRELPLSPRCCALQVIKCIMKGSTQRVTAAMQMNPRSSRGHSIVILNVVAKTKVKMNKCWRRPSTTFVHTAHTFTLLVLTNPRLDSILTFMSSEAIF